MDKDATRTEVHQAEVKNETKRNYRALYKTADTSCKNFIMEVVDETRYKELKEPDTFYTNVTALKLLNHLTEFCSRLHNVDAVDIPKSNENLFINAEGIPQYINAMEVAQRKPKRAKLVIHEKCMHAVALKSLLQSGEYKQETREWTNSWKTSKPGWCGKLPYWRLTLKKDTPKPTRREKKKPLVVRHIRSCTCK